MATHNSLKIVEVYQVVPLPNSQDTTTPKSLPLTFFDILWLRLAPVQRVFFYETSISITTFLDSILPKLKHSLSLTLQHFLPLAGTLVWPPESKPIINYKEGDAVSFTVAESNANFYNLSGNNFVQAVEYHPLVPDLATFHERAKVLALQVTMFPNYGLCIGITAHHAVLDGQSSTMFMKSWAHLCKLGGNALSLVPELTPSFDRMVIKDPAGLEAKFLNQWLNHDGPHNKSLKVWELTTPPDLVRGTFELTCTKLEKLRQLIKSKLEENNNQEQALRLSRLTLTFAYTWVCLVKAEGLSDTNLLLCINADARPRLEPPMPASYFGNCVTGHLAVADRNDLLGEKGLAVAIKAITEAIGSLDYGVLIRDAENCLSLLLTLKEGQVAQRIAGIAGSPRFELYNTDFGWGKPTKVEMISIDKTGAISVSESRDDAGGIQIGLVLKKHEMEVFASVFAKGLEVL
ncbi:hypothetical protein CMV_006612 [Castanea mollissima]|uniref:Uncharacterized protein n=1 Tax=Castanea mollissima TaxID=60419 RepID=A0A8J4RQR3_9ROSI|nr:hypothetical protein CMV_006612 [Castanea mollissima]